METWFFFGLASYISLAFTTIIDKRLMEQKLHPFVTNMFQMFLNGTLLLLFGSLFFTTNFSFTVLKWSLALGIMYAIIGSIFFYTISKRDVQTVMPFLQSARILLLFIAAIILFNETTTLTNIVGVLCILPGVYLVLSKNGYTPPKTDRIFFMILFSSLVGVLYALSVKKALFTTEPLSLVIGMYLTTGIILFIVQSVTDKKHFRKVRSHLKHIPKILSASFFAAIGSLLFYEALSMGEASKIYAIAGIKSVFVVLFAWSLLKEKFSVSKLIGIILVFGGIFLLY